MQLFKKFIRLGLIITLLTVCLSLTAFAAENPAFEVLINENLATFSDVTPMAKDGHIFVPFRAVFEALGAQVAYDASANTVKAVRGETTVSFAIGDPYLQITKEGTDSTIESDTVSFAENSIVMIPVRYAAEAFDCIVGWDNDTKTVLILDMDSLLQANDAKYTLMDQYLALSQSYQKEPHSINGTIDLSMNFTADDQNVPVEMNGTISGLLDSSAINMDLNLTLDLDDLLAASNEEPDAETQMMLAMMQNMQVKYILNIAEGKVYIQYPSSNAWVYMNLSELVDNYADMMSVSTTEHFTDYCKYLVGLFPLTNEDALTDGVELLSMLNSACSDNSFEKKGDCYVNTLSYSEEGITAEGTLEFKMKNNILSAVSMSINVNEITPEDEEILLDASYNMSPEGKVTMNMTFDIQDIMSMTMLYNLSYAETDEHPLSEPEDGSTIIPLDSLMN